MIETIAFYGIGSLLLMAALCVVTFTNMFHSALALSVTLILTAAIFVLMGADFLAAGQVLVYVGGIMVIMLFVVMFSQRAKDGLIQQTLNRWPMTLALAGVIAALLTLRFGEHLANVGHDAGISPTSAVLGQLLLTDMRIPFEAVSLVLLAALVGAIVLVGQETKGAAK